MNDQQLIDEGYVEGKKSFEYYWKSIEELFDFEKVYKAMKALDWHWTMGNGRDGIPTVKTIKESVYRNCKEVYENESKYCSGGFEIGWEDGGIYVLFSIEDCFAD